MTSTFFISTGPLLERGYWQRSHDRRRTGAKYPFGHQFLGIIAEEALAERSFSLHQEHYGSRSTSVLKLLKCNKNAVQSGTTCVSHLAFKAL